MARWQRFALVLSLLVVLNGATIAVLMRNLEHGVYAPEADAIMIPIMNGIISSVVVIVALAIIFALTRSPWPQGLAGSSKFPRSCRTIATLLLYVPGLLFGLASVGEFAIPNHYPLAVVSLLFTLSVVDLLVRDINSLRSKSRIGSPSQG